MKFTPGPAIASASGSIGGTTFSHNQFGAYTRKRSIPTNPNTDRQQAVKANFSYLSSIWNQTLTEAQRQGWADYGANVPRIDSLGQSHYLTGLQWFIGFNTLRLQDAGPVLFVAPTTFNRGEMPALISIANSMISPSNPAGGTYLNLNGGPALLNLQLAVSVPDSARLMVYMGRPQNPTINFYKAPWRYWGSVETAEQTQFSLATAGTPPIVGPFPFAYTEGQVAFVRLRLIYGDGRYTPPSDYKLAVWDVSE